MSALVHGTTDVPLQTLKNPNRHGLTLIVSIEMSVAPPCFGGMVVALVRYDLKAQKNEMDHRISVAKERRKGNMKGRKRLVPARRLRDCPKQPWTT
jgi:hypothetical protein